MLFLRVGIVGRCSRQYSTWKAEMVVENSPWGETRGRLFDSQFNLRRSLHFISCSLNATTKWHFLAPHIVIFRDRLWKSYGPSYQALSVSARDQPARRMHLPVYSKLMQHRLFEAPVCHQEDTLDEIFTTCCCSDSHTIVTSSGSLTRDSGLGEYTAHLLSSTLFYYTCPFYVAPCPLFGLNVQCITDDCRNTMASWFQFSWRSHEPLTILGDGYLPLSFINARVSCLSIIVPSPTHVMYNPITLIPELFALGDLVLRLWAFLSPVP